MANSKFEYVKKYERPDFLLPSTYIVVRVDGRGFQKCSQDHLPMLKLLADFLRFTNKYAFEKPNDRSALDLMNEAATAVLSELPDICLAYGVSDEFRSNAPMHILSVPWLMIFSFVFDKSCELFDRRERSV